MSGQSNYGADRVSCPACGADAYCESVDVGVGLYVSGDYVCTRCGWESDGPEDFGFLGMDEVPFAPPHATPA